MSRAERRALVERTDRALPVSQQCQLLAVSRSSVYRRPAEVGEEDRTIMALIDRHYLARPYYGSRRMAAWLATQGHLVNRKRVQRLMRLTGCGKTQKTGTDFRVSIVNTRDDCRDRGIGTALERGSGGVFRIEAQYGHGYAAMPNSLGRRTRL